MGRLIDIDDVIKAVDKHTKDESEVVLDEDITVILEEVLTAYDVEKVVAELEYQKEKCEEDMKYYKEKSWKDHVSHTNYDLFFMKSDCLEDVIEIVKRGGMEWLNG